MRRRWIPAKAGMKDKTIPLEGMYLTVMTFPIEEMIPAQESFSREATIPTELMNSWGVFSSLLT